MYKTKLIYRIINFYRKHGFLKIIKRVSFEVRKLITPLFNTPKNNIKYYQPTSGKSDLKILFYIGCNEGESKRYRVSNLVEGLNKVGVECLVTNQTINDFSKLVDLQLIVLFRSILDVHVQSIVYFANRNYIPIVFDVDDLVFDESVASKLDVYDRMSTYEKNDYLEGVRGYYKCMLSSDFITCSTNCLANKAKKISSKESFLIKNTINHSQLKISNLKVNRSINRLSEDEVFLSYFSGSNTHQKDFEEVENALFNILKEYKNVVFYLVGKFDLSNKFSKFKDRIICKPFLPYLEMLKLLSLMDINIAPLECNDFNDCKSELKIFEAGIVNVPTIASATESYKNFLIHEKNGMLAHNSKEWYQSMKKLIDNKKIRERIGKQAYIDSYKYFYIDNEIENIVGIYHSIKRKYKQKTKDLLSVAWIIPEPFAGSGGHRNIFRAVRQMQSHSFLVDVYVISGIDINCIKTTVSNNFFDISGANFYQYTGKLVKKYDIGFATQWATVYSLLENSDLVANKFYFVQDFEPMFYPMGVEYIMAENTYKLGLTHITSGPWPAKILRERYSAKAYSFQFPIETAIYNTNLSRTKENKNIIFFAKPEMPRRCYEIGLAALEIVSQELDIEIILFGSKKIRSSSVLFAHTNLGLLPAVEDLNRLYRNADLGIVFSTTNPSLVPYEMMASGLAVADIKLEYSLVNYGSENNVFLVDSVPKKMAEDIITIIKDDNLRATVAENGRKFTAENFYEEEKMGQAIVDIVKNKIRGAKTK